MTTARRRLDALARLLIALPTVHRARRALARTTTTEVLRSLRAPGAARHLGGDPKAWGRAASRAARLLRAGCMPQATALVRLLTATGHGADLVLGARRDATGAWVAHAWVEVDGTALGADPAAFTRLAAARAGEAWQITPAAPNPPAEP